MGCRVLLIALYLGNAITFVAFCSRGSRLVFRSWSVTFLIFLEHIVPSCLGLFQNLVTGNRCHFSLSRIYFRHVMYNASSIGIVSETTTSSPTTTKPTTPSPTAYTTLAFGASFLLTGICILLSPGFMLSTLSLPDASLPAICANALVAVAMGIYYTLAFVQDNRTFFVATFPMRMLTAVVLGMQEGFWVYVALWEGIGAGFTGVMLALEEFQTRLGGWC